MNIIAKLLSLWGLVAICSGCTLKDTSTSSSQPGNGKNSGNRNMYSPDIYGDAKAQQQWIAGVEALEEQCRRTGNYCQEVEGARKALKGYTGGVSHPAR